MKRISIDLETASSGKIDFQHDPVIQINIAWAPGQAAVIPWSVVLDNQKVFSAIDNLLRDPDIEIIGHNFKFDAKFLYRYFKVIPEKWFDTMLAHHLIDERRGTHALYSVSPRFVGLDTWEHKIQPFLPSRSTPFSAVPAKVLGAYGARDADCELRLSRQVRRDLRNKPFEKLFYSLVTPATRVFTEVELMGIKVDRKYLKKLRKETKTKIVFAEKLISDNGRINLNSPKQLAEWLYDEEKVPMIEGRTTRMGVLEKIDHPKVKALVEYRHMQKLEGTYLKPIYLKAKADSTVEGNFVYPDYQQHGTVTGRLTEPGVGLMTMPRQSWMRDIFIARKGCRFVTVDYKASEVRWIGVYSGDLDLRRIVNSGRDIHTEVAMQMFGYDREAWSNLSEDRQKQLRIYSKAVVFGLLYGRGTQSLAAQLQISVEESRKYIDTFFAQFPGVRRWMVETQRKAIREGYLTTVFGRQRRWGYVPPDFEHQVARQAVNFLPSSSSTDMCLLSYVHCFKRVEGVVNAPIFIHDGFTLEVRKEAVDEAAAEAKAICEDVEGIHSKIFNFDTKGVKFTVDCVVGKRWGTHFN